MTNKEAKEKLYMEWQKFLEDYTDYTGISEAYKMAFKALEQEPCEDTISRKSIKQKLQEHHDFFINAYGGFSNLPQNDKSRVDEITNCIAMVVNEPPVTPQEPFKPMVEIDLDYVIKQKYIEREVLDKISAEVENINVWGMRYNPDTDKDRKPQIVQKVKEHIIEILDKYKAETEDNE